MSNVNVNRYLIIVTFCKKKVGLVAGFPIAVEQYHQIDNSSFHRANKQLVCLEVPFEWNYRKMMPELNQFSDCLQCGVANHDDFVRMENLEAETTGDQRTAIL